MDNLDFGSLNGGYPLVSYSVIGILLATCCRSVSRAACPGGTPRLDLAREPSRLAAKRSAAIGARSW